MSIQTKKGFKGLKSFTCKGCGEKPNHLQNIDLNTSEGDGGASSYGSWECNRCHFINTTNAQETNYLFRLIMEQQKGSTIPDHEL